MKRNNQILDILHPTIWKSVLQIQAEIYQCGDSISIGALHNRLNHLEDCGLVTSQLCEVSRERLILRGGRKELEYKLTEKGLLKRVQNNAESQDSYGAAPDGRSWVSIARACEAASPKRGETIP